MLFELAHSGLGIEDNFQKHLFSIEIALVCLFLRVVLTIFV